MEEFGLWDPSRKLQKITRDDVLIPVKSGIKAEFARILTRQRASLDIANYSHEATPANHQNTSSDIPVNKGTSMTCDAKNGTSTGSVQSGRRVDSESKRLETPPDLSCDVRTQCEECNSRISDSSSPTSSLGCFHFVLGGIEGAIVTTDTLPPSKKVKMKTSHVKLREILRELAEENEVQWTEDLERYIPRHWEVHGDLILLPDLSLQRPEWSSLLEGRWRQVADALGCKRLAQKSRIQSDDYRSPNVKLLFGKDSWVEHIDNKIRWVVL